MKEYVRFNRFYDLFQKLRPNSFSYEGLRALFEYIEQLEEETGEEIEFDVIALCGEYSEYKDLKEFQKDFGKEDYPDIEAIEQETTLIRIDEKSFIVRVF